MFSRERLCRIHAELGEGMLSYTCSTYPRILHEFGDVEEASLALSCPEAARLVLLNPSLLKPEPDCTQPAPEWRETGGREAGNQGVVGPAFPPDFKRVRATVLELLQIRSYPLWQRMFLLGLMCRRLDSIAGGKLKGTAEEFLGGFRAAVASGSLRPAMETLPVDPNAQLDVVLLLAGLMLHRSNGSPRFSAVVQAFTTGIGNKPGATLESLTRQYTLAHDVWFAPFIHQHPQILENYLVNTIIRCLFPCWREGMQHGAMPQMAREFAQLTAQFTLIRGLLTGWRDSMARHFQQRTW
jgi:lysine-N-methylase